MNEDESLAPYEVFEGTAWEAGLLKSILDDNQIESIIRDTSRMPWNTFPMSTSAVKVFVARMNLNEAGRIVEEFRKNMENPAEFDPETEID